MDKRNASRLPAQKPPGQAPRAPPKLPASPRPQTNANPPRPQTNVNPPRPQTNANPPRPQSQVAPKRAINHVPAPAPVKRQAQGAKVPPQPVHQGAKPPIQGKPVQNHPPPQGNKASAPPPPKLVAHQDHKRPPPPSPDRHPKSRVDPKAKKHEEPASEVAGAKGHHGILAGVHLPHLHEHVPPEPEPIAPEDKLTPEEYQELKSIAPSLHPSEFHDKHGRHKELPRTESTVYEAVDPEEPLPKEERHSIPYVFRESKADKAVRRALELRNVTERLEREAQEANIQSDPDNPLEFDHKMHQKIIAASSAQRKAEEKAEKLKRIEAEKARKYAEKVAARKEKEHRKQKHKNKEDDDDSIEDKWYDY